LIVKFGLKNFKGIIDANINIKPITILIGANGSGKSSIGQALLLIRQSVGSDQLRPNGNFIRLGNIEDLFFKRDFTNLIEFYIKGKSDGIFFSEELVYSDNGLKSLEFEIRNGFKLGGTDKEINPSTVHTSEGVFKLVPTRRPSEPLGYRKVMISDIKSEFEIKETMSDFREKFSIFKKQFEKIWYIPPIRGTISDYNKLLTSESNNITSTISGEDIYDKLMTLLGHQSNKLHTVSKWCKEILDVELNIRTGRGTTITLETERQSILNKNENIYSILINEGFGLNQLILLLAQLALASEDSIVIIDEPEIHLHPEAQAKLMTILVKEAIENKKQLIITTHSEHILFQALTMVGLKELNQKDLALYYFFKEKDGCFSKKLEFNKQGRLEETLPGFFEANLERFKRYMNILSEKG